MHVWSEWLKTKFIYLKMGKIRKTGRNLHEISEALQFVKHLLSTHPR